MHNGFEFITSSDGEDIFFNVSDLAGIESGMDVHFNDGDSVELMREILRKILNL